MKIVKLSASTFPPPIVEKLHSSFVRQLEALSNRLGVAVNTVGGIVVFNPERDEVVYEQNPCSGDLEPVIQEIDKIKTASTASAQFDFQSFSAELRELSNRHQIKLVSVGAMSGLDSGAKGTTWLAIWADGNEK